MHQMVINNSNKYKNIIKLDICTGIFIEYVNMMNIFKNIGLLICSE